MSTLAGKRILLVEDEFIVAAMVADMLAELGATVIGPAGTIALGCCLARTETIDAAVLDVNLNGARCEPIAETLQARRIPFVFATGYGDEAFAHAPDAPVLDKPYTEEKLAGALAHALSVGGEDSPIPN